MNQSFYTLEIVGGTTKKCVDWGIDLHSLNRTRQVIIGGEVTFALTVADVYADTDFDAEPEIIIRRGATFNERGVQIGQGAIWFRGDVVEINRPCEAGAKRIQIRATDAIARLADHTFEQVQKFWTGELDPVTHKPAPNYNTFFTSDVLLPWRWADGWITCEDQIREALNYAITYCNVPLQIGTLTITPTAYNGGRLPLRQERNITISEVIRTMLAATPDVAPKIDYTTSPYPTYSARRWADAPVKTLKIGEVASGGDGVVVKTDIRPLITQRVPGVLLRFRKVNQVNDRVGVQLTTQEYPATTPAGSTQFLRRALLQTIDLTGFRKLTQTVDISTAALDYNNADDAIRAAWWAAHDEANLQDPLISDIVITDVAAEDTDGNAVTPLLNELLPDSGPIPDWLEAQGVEVEEVVVRCRASWKKWKDEAHTQIDADLTQAGVKIPIAVRLQSTNAETRSYTDVTFTPSIDLEPAGFARFIYDGVGILHYAGTIQIIEAALSETIDVGDRINLTRGRAPWATMKALVYSIADNAGSAESVITLGPPRFLGTQDLIELLRTNRINTVMARSTSEATTGQTGSDSTVSLGKKSLVRNTTSGFGGTGGGVAGWG